MAHYAFLDENNVVVSVIVGKDEDQDGVDWEEYYGGIANLICKRTSYNTLGGVHQENKTPFRKNYASIGYTYDPQRDAFIPPKPHNSWVLNEETCTWAAPVAYPTDGKRYRWDEPTTSWVELT